MNASKITILMPAYNAAKYIAEAIQSVLEQTFTDFELLIVNNGSTDATLSIIRQFSDPRIRVVTQPQRGISMALNTGLTEAKGSYIARFDADDICFPERLQKQASFLDNNPGYVLVGCDVEYMAENGEHLFNYYCTGHTHEDIIQQLYVYCPFIHSAVMYRKEAALQAGGYAPDAHTFEDHFLWTRLVKYGNYYNLPEQLVKVRYNPGSATIDEKWRSRRFRNLRKNIIHRGTIFPEEGNALLNIIKNQDTLRLKEAAYYALCGKKFLVDNYHPGKARIHFTKAIRHYPFRFDNYAFYMLSFFPRSFIHWLHRRSPNKI